jgi:hypothetical protein
MNLKNRLLYSGLFAFAILIISILFPIVPCQFAANVPNPEYSWSMCRLNPDELLIQNSLVYYFGYTRVITEGYFIILILSFAVSYGFFHLTRRKKHKR